MKIDILLNRFLRGALAGAISALAAITPVSLNNIGELRTWLFMAGFAALSGFLTGGILTLDKALRWKAEVPEEEKH